MISQVGNTVLQFPNAEQLCFCVIECVCDCRTKILGGLKGSAPICLTLGGLSSKPLRYTCNIIYSRKEEYECKKIISKNDKNVFAQDYAFAALSVHCSFFGSNLQIYFLQCNLCLIIG